MERLTKLNGIGEYELQACFDCGPGCGPDNENCGNCEKAQAGTQRLGEYENTDLEPSEILQLNDFSNSQCAKLLAKNGELERKLAVANKALKMACAFFPNGGHTDEYFIKRAREALK